VPLYALHTGHQGKCPCFRREPGRNRLAGHRPRREMPEHPLRRPRRRPPAAGEPCPKAPARQAGPPPGQAAAGRVVCPSWTASTKHGHTPSGPGVRRPASPRPGRSDRFYPVRLGLSNNITGYHRPAAPRRRTTPGTCAGTPPPWAAANAASSRRGDAAIRSRSPRTSGGSPARATAVATYCSGRKGEASN
jgi:hypothetical protein